jgi:hypothetical protein
MNLPVWWILLASLSYQRFRETMNIFPGLEKSQIWLSRTWKWLNLLNSKSIRIVRFHSILLAYVSKDISRRFWYPYLTLAWNSILMVLRRPFSYKVLVLVTYLWSFPDLSWIVYWKSGRLNLLRWISFGLKNSSIFFYQFDLILNWKSE